MPVLPGAEPFPAALSRQLDAAFAARETTEAPRTRHRNGTIPHFMNRLILETSPYLRQHAHNPVNWYAWGDEAFEEARRRRCPVFLSIGYSTCHWCHVMEEESFEDLEIARFLNERYVAIKVDREDRPDVDAVYMTAVQALTGQGGWPMSVWLDGERRPFFAGTYFPARDGDRGAGRGFLSLLRELAELYRRDPERVAEAAQSITDAIRSAMRGPSSNNVIEKLPAAETLDAAARWYAALYDPVHGGLRGAPKFPSSLPIRFLLRQHRRTNEPQLLTMAVHTLEMMAAGGMHDQLGGGFHRYSTDERWLVPHFEKMLYDNALLALAYAEAWQVTKRPDFARVLRTTLDYVIRDMTSPQGAFYAATDADSEGEEGTFFLWSEPEIRRLLGTAAERFMRYYGVSSHGNFEGKNILFVPHPDEAEWEALATPRETLRAARAERSHPLRDDKILTAWNGLMISALAFGGFVQSESRYVDAAARAAEYILERSPGGRVQRSSKGGRASGPGFLEDDAFFIAGLLDLYEATFERRYLAEALRLARETEVLFADSQGGGWYRSAADHETLVAREKPNHDGAEPSGASVQLRNALRLAAFTADERWDRIARAALRAYASMLQRPAALPEMLLGIDAALNPGAQIVLVWPHDRAQAEPFLERLRSRFLPSRILVGAGSGEPLASLAQLTTLVRDKSAISTHATAYVCQRGACRLPATDPSAMESELSAF
ncbi:MAG: thioredoxin domain-containing protein [Candidatus Eremiobacteraeota bacterium]|nr:thioredoxin domain-containing protein [Candidatus Eremiobacteraeota bacterium]